MTRLILLIEWNLWVMEERNIGVMEFWYIGALAGCRIGSNIAEAYSRRSINEYLQFSYTH